LIREAGAELWVSGSGRCLTSLFRRLDHQSVPRRGDSITPRGGEAPGKQTDLAVADQVLDDLGPLSLYISALRLRHAHLTDRLKFLEWP
jgi:hypothetical protein